MIRGGRIDPGGRGPSPRTSACGPSGFAVLLAVVLAAGLLTAPAAFGHATVLETAPANGATLERPPKRVELTFNEAVEARFGALQVVDAQGERVDDDTIVRPTDERIAIGLRPGTADGSYAATYRVVSADGHPVSGGISFVIGAPSAGGVVDVSRVLAGTSAPAGIGTALSVARAVRYAGTAAVVGWVAFLLVAWRPVRRVLARPDGAGPDGDRPDGAGPDGARPDGARPDGARPDGARLPAVDAAREPAVDAPAAAALGRTADRWVRVAALLGAVGVAATFVLQGANVAGTGVLPALRPAAWGDVAQTRTGLWLLIALALLLVLAVLLPWVGTALRAGRVTLVTVATVALALLLAATPALGGHAAASHPAGPLVALQTVHVAAIGAWLGGLVLLGLLLRAVGAVTDDAVLVRAVTDGAVTDGVGTDRATTANAATDDAALRTRLRVALLDGFGALAITAVLALIVAGVVLSIVQLSALGDLIDSAYGRAILLKALLTTAAVAVALVQRRRMTPRVAAAVAGGTTAGHVGEAPSGHADDPDADHADRTVRRLIAVEVGLLVAVLAATGALAGYGQPGRTSSSASASAPLATSPSGPLIREITVDGRRLLRLELDPGVAGANEVTVRVIGIDGRPDRHGRDPRLRLRGPEGRQLDVPLRRASRGRWIASGVALAPAGAWTARLQLRTSAFDEDDVTFEVPVR